MRLFGLIGFPLIQSFSQKYFTEKFEREGLTDCRFDNFELTSVGDIIPLIAHHPALQGLAVTIPFKKTVLAYLHESNLPEGLHACNCIRVRDGKLTGFNTDHVGFTKSLQPLIRSHHKKALVLGNGGATSAVLYSLRSLGIEHLVVSRQVHEGSDITYSEVNEDVINSHHLIINTTPLGMFPKTEEYPLIPYEFIGKQHLLFDLVYNPEQTMFLIKGAQQGAEVKNGKEMLELQAEENWRIWEGEQRGESGDGRLERGEGE